MIKSVSIKVRYIPSGCGVVGVSHIPQMCSCEARAYNMLFFITTECQLNYTFQACLLHLKAYLATRLWQPATGREEGE